MPKLIPEIELRVHLAKAEEFWRQDRLDVANEAMRRALKVGIPSGHNYNLQRTIEAEWGTRQTSSQSTVHNNLIIEAQPERFDWWDRLISISIGALQKVSDALDVGWSKPILITLFPYDEWVEFMHARYGYYTNREPIHKICLPPAACGNPGIFRRAVTHEITHAAVYELGGDAVPRWFNEGLAVVMEGSASAHPVLPKLRLNEISAGFESFNMDLSSPRAGHCYALAGEFVGRLVKTYGMRSLRDNLTRIGQGESSEKAFEEAFGLRQETVEQAWIKQ
jgi:hypothetical protein